MIRWGFAVLLVAAIVSRYTPVAFAGCEGGDSSMGHNAIAFCCDKDGGDRDKGGGRSKSDRVISGPRAK